MPRAAAVLKSVRPLLPRRRRRLRDDLRQAAEPVVERVRRVALLVEVGVGVLAVRERGDAVERGAVDLARGAGAEAALERDVDRDRRSLDASARDRVLGRVDEDLAA